MSKQVSLVDVLNFDNSLFTDKQAVKSNYALSGIKDILHRDNEIKKYYTYLKDIFRGVSPNNIFVYGTAGVGKTVLSKWVFEEIKKEAVNRNIELCIIKVKCDVSKTENSIWQAINDQMPTPEGEEKRRIGNSISKHAKYFEHLMNEYPGILIIILDEIDKAEDPEMINKIIRMESEASGQFPSIIGITNDLYIYDRFPSYLISVLSQHELVITPYDAEQLIDIINARVKMAFKPNVVGGNVVSLCAALAAQENGDARKAIDLLRIAGELAEERNSGTIEEIDVRNANDVVEIERTTEIIKTLPTQSKVTLLASIYILNSDKICTTTNVYTVYERICTHLDIDILTWRRITDLISELDMLGIMSVSIISQGRYGRKKQITSIVSRQELLKTLLQDFRLKPLIDIPAYTFLSAFRGIFD